MEEMVALFGELVSSVISIIWGVLPFIGIWLVFEKAGESGWKAIIPLYNMYTLLKITDKQKYWKLYLAGFITYLIAVVFIVFYAMWGVMAMIFAFATVDLGWDALAALLPVFSISCIITLTGYILMTISMVHAYLGVCNKMNISKGFAAGLFFLSPIFWMLLGAGKEYQWNKQCAQYNDMSAQEWQDPYATFDTPSSPEE